MSFISDYLSFNAGNEASPHYHLWGALSALSASVSRKVWLDFGYFSYYPQLYVVLLGPPGNKKTLAMELSKSIVREVGGIPFSAECQSKEKLVKDLAEYEQSFTYDATKPPYIYTPMCSYVTELSQFIGIDPARMIDFLVTVYNASVYEMRTIKHDVQLVVGPYYTLLGCTTPDWITNYLKTDIITGGFSRRCNFVLEWEDNKRIAFPEVSPEMRAARERCVKRCVELRQLYGEFKWDATAKSYYKHWYETRTISKDPSLTYYDRTCFEQVLKIAMLHAVADSNDLVMRQDYIDAGIFIVQTMMEKLPQVFQGLGRNELSAVSHKLESQLRRAGIPIPDKEMQTLLWSDANGVEYQNIVSHLVNSGKIIKFSKDVECDVRNSDGTVKKQKLTKYWLALPDMLKPTPTPQPAPPQHPAIEALFDPKPPLPS